jgi:hypothetical protein
MAREREGGRRIRAGRGFEASTLRFWASRLKTLVAGFADLSGTDNHDPHACDDRDTAKTAGFIAVGLGAAAVVAGIVLVVSNKTTVSRMDPSSAPYGASQAPVRLTLQGIEF